MNTNNDSIIRNSNEEPKLYDNYKKGVDNYIESQLGTINNIHFNHIENNEDNGEKNSELTKQKKVYLNTYIIPLLYLINSYMYHKYLNNKKIIVNNILINDEIDYYSNYFFDYKLPIVKKFNIAIYKNYFKNKNESKSKPGSNSESKPESNSESKPESKPESNSKKINNSKIKLIIGHLTNINKDLKKLSEPYKIKQEIKNLENQFNIRIGKNNEDTLTNIQDTVFRKYNNMNNNKKKKFINRLKDIQKIYNKSENKQIGGTVKVTDDKIRKKFFEAIKDVLNIPNNTNNTNHKNLTNKINKIKIKTIKRMIKDFISEAVEEEEKTVEAKKTEAAKEKTEEAAKAEAAKEKTEEAAKAAKANNNYIPIIIPEIETSSTKKKGGGNNNIFITISNNIEDIIEDLNIYIDKKNNKISREFNISINNTNFNKDSLDDLYKKYIINTLQDIFSLLNIILNNSTNTTDNPIDKIIDNIKDKKIELSKKFSKVIKNTNKDIFNKKIVYQEMIYNYNNEKISIEKQKKDHESTKKNLDEEIKKEKEIEKKIKNFDNEIIKLTENQTSTDFTAATIGISFDHSKSSEKLDQYKKRQKTYRNITKSITSKENGKKELEKELNSIQHKKKKLYEIENEIQDYSNEIQDYSNEIKKLTEESQKNSKFELESYKNIITDFLNKNIELSRLIIDINQEIESKKERDLFKNFYDKDPILKNIIGNISKNNNNNQNNNPNNNQNNNPNNNQNNNNNNQKLFTNIKKYISDIKSKNKNTINKTFFPKIMDELNKFSFNQEINQYINNLKDIHDKKIKDISKKMDNMYEKKNLHESVTRKINENMDEYNKYKKQYNEKYNKPLKTINKIYVYTYTDSIKLYFFILNMIHFILCNYEK